MATSQLSKEYLDGALSRLEACPDEKKREIFLIFLPESARNGNIAAQFLLAEHHRNNHDSGRSVKWMRVASQAGYAGATRYLADGYAYIGKSNGLKSAEDYIQFARAGRQSIDAFYLEDMLQEAVDLAIKEKNYSSLNRAYINIGNINLSNLENRSNDEFGKYGFSVERARYFYDLAIGVSQKQKDVVGEAIGLSAMLVSYEYGNEKSGRCSTYARLAALYASNKKKIDGNQRAYGVSSALKENGVGCSR